MSIQTIITDDVDHLVIPSGTQYVVVTVSSLSTTTVYDTKEANLLAGLTAIGTLAILQAGGTIIMQGSVAP